MLSLFNNTGVTECDLIVGFISQTGHQIDMEHHEHHNEVSVNFLKRSVSCLLI
jgi:hypothetical protein